MVTTVQYAFTVTLRPKLYAEPAQAQFDKTYFTLYTLLKSLSADDLTIVAEQTKNFNVHYHGIINFIYDPRVFAPKLFTDAFRNHKLFGFVNIKQIDDLSGWMEYIKKDLPLTKQCINRPPIIKDSKNHLKQSLDLYQSFEDQ